MKLCWFTGAGSAALCGSFLFPLSLILSISCARNDFHVNESPAFIWIDYSAQPIPSPRAQTATDITHAVQPEPRGVVVTIIAQSRQSQQECAVSHNVLSRLAILLFIYFNPWFASCFLVQIIVLSYHNQNILGKILTHCCEGLKDSEFFEKKPLA